VDSYEAGLEKVQLDADVIVSAVLHVNQLRYCNIVGDAQAINRGGVGDQPVETIHGRREANCHHVTRTIIAICRFVHVIFNDLSIV